MTSKEKRKERAFISVMVRYCELLHTSPKTKMQQEEAENIATLVETLMEARNV